MSDVNLQFDRFPMELPIASRVGILECTADAVDFDDRFKTAVREARQSKSFVLICTHALTRCGLARISDSQRQYSHRSVHVIEACGTWDAIRRDAGKLELIRRNLLAGVPYALLVPFVTSRPASGPAFFGRRPELAKLSVPDCCFSICAPGGYGKSSLIAQTLHRRRHEDPERHDRTVSVDMLGINNLNEAATMLAKAVNSNKTAQTVTVDGLEQFLVHEKASTLRFRGGPIEIFLDEVDTLLGRDRNTEHAVVVDRERESTKILHKYPLLTALKRAYSRKCITLVISAREETGRLLHHVENPFAVADGSTRISPLALKPWPMDQAWEAVSGPLAALGYPVDHPEERKRIRRALAGTDGIPFRVAQTGYDLAWDTEKLQYPIRL